MTEPLRDWFPLSASSVLSDVTDLLQGPGADWGTLKCGCHPDCGVGMGFMVSKKTKEWAPVSAFVNVDRVLQDAKVIADSARGRSLTTVQTALSVLRNYSPLSAPKGFRLIDLVRKFDKQSGGQLGGRLGACEDGNRKNDEWLLMFVAGMWFQDLWTYDFRRTEMCIIPYATQMGEISFCAYNTGVGWRHIVEKMYQNATVADWSQITAGTWLRDTLERLRRPDTIDACQPGRDLQATLRHYQVDGVRWLWFMTELGLEGWYRDVRAMRLYEGTGEILRANVAKTLGLPS